MDLADKIIFEGSSAPVSFRMAPMTGGTSPDGWLSADPCAQPYVPEVGEYHCVIVGTPFEAEPTGLIFCTIFDLYAQYWCKGTL